MYLKTDSLIQSWNRFKTGFVDISGNDIDVHKVREARHKIIVLRNDLKELILEIEEGIHNLHQQSREGVGAKNPSGNFILENGESGDMHIKTESG